MDNALCACGHPRHEGRCREWIRHGDFFNRPCPCTAWTKPVENVTPKGMVDRLQDVLNDAGLTPYLHKTGCDMKGCDCAPKQHDPVSAPSHYTRFPGGIQPIHLTRHLSYNLGSAVAYLARSGHKGDAVEDLRKAIFHIEDEIRRLGVKP